MTTENPETPSEVGAENATYWLDEIKAAQDRNKEWYDSVKSSIDRYEDKGERSVGSLNIFWANTETQKSALDDDFGSPQVTRINAVSGNGLSRQVSMVLEQTLDAAVKDTGDNSDIAAAVHQSLLTAQGQVWLELNPILDSESNVVRVEAPLVQVDYKDYLEGECKRWDDLPWAARAHNFTLDDLKRILNGSKIQPDDVPRNYKLSGHKEEDSKAKQEQFSRARVWEIWAKFPDKRRIYVAEDFDKVLLTTPDPYRLKGFFPCPRPITTNIGISRQSPITDYSRYVDQCAEIDRISQRIYVLTEILKNNFAYDARFEDLRTLLTADDNTGVAIDNWAELAQGGGLDAVIQYPNLAPIIAILGQLHQQRRELIQLSYELTGISDLARGQTDPNETLGAQKLKRSFGNGRFKSRFKESRRFAKDAYAIKGELIAEHFPRDQIQEMSGIALPTLNERIAAQQQLQAMQASAQQMQEAGVPMPPVDEDAVAAMQRKANARYTWEQIAGVLRSDARRSYMIDISTDQADFVDEEAEKEQRIAFTTAINSLFQQFGPMIAGNPANGQVFKKLIMFTLAAFKAGRSMEDGIEQAIDGAIQAAQQGGQKQDQADPLAEMQQKLLASQVESAQIKLETDKALGQLKIQIEQAHLQIKQMEVHLAERKANAKAVEQEIDTRGKMADAMMPNTQPMLQR